MHLRDIVERDGTTFSFEFFPPKSEAGWDALFDRIVDFETLKPSFVSVTYGAGGSTREHTHELVVRLRRETALDAIPHLTCTGHDEAVIEGILERYAQAGVANVLAVRGDPLIGEGEQRPPEAIPHAIDLVRLIQRFNEDGRHPNSRGFGVIVAGFPEGHPQTPNRLVQMDHLKAKVDQGADAVISQMFFDNAAFFDWCERCRVAGITVPLIAGLMPITSLAGMRRMAELAAGTNFPAPLQKMIYRCQDDPEAVARVGVHWASEQARGLIDHGVDGVHFYTLNQSDATRRIFETLGARDASVLR